MKQLSIKDQSRIIQVNKNLDFVQNFKKRSIYFSSKMEDEKISFNDIWLYELQLKLPYIEREPVNLLIKDIQRENHSECYRIENNGRL
jgi:hypothetical protein